MTNLSDLTVAALVEAIAADQPAPGAGAAAAVSLALAAACAGKAFAISARHHPDSDGLADAATAARALAGRALAGATRDAADFAAVLHAHGDHGPEAALKADGEALLALVDELRGLVRTHGPQVIPSLAGDISAALNLAGATERVHRRNLEALGPD